LGKSHRLEKGRFGGKVVIPILGKIPLGKSRVGNGCLGNGRLGKSRLGIGEVPIYPIWVYLSIFEGFGIKKVG
jgi:hypothetical protein